MSQGLCTSYLIGCFMVRLRFDWLQLIYIYMYIYIYKIFSFKRIDAIVASCTHRGV